QFPSRCQNRFPQHFEAPQFFQGQTEINFFADKIPLIEAANRIEISSAGKKKCTRAEIEPEVKSAKHADKNAAPQRNNSIRNYARAAACVTRPQGADRFDNMRFVYASIGVHEEEVLTIRGACAGITCGRNLASIDRDDAGACGCQYLFF